MANQDMINQMADNIQRRLIGKIAGGYGPDFQTPLEDRYGLGNVSTPDALEIVFYAQAKGIDPIDVHVWYQRKYIKEKGGLWVLKSMTLVKAPSTNIVMAWAKAQGEPFQIFTYKMDDKLRHDHGLGPDDIGYVSYLVPQASMPTREKMIVRLLDDPKYDKATFTEVEIRATQVVGVQGIGVGRSDEKITPPKGKSIAFIIEKRARQAAVTAHFGEMTSYNKPVPITQARLNVPDDVADLGSETIARHLSLPASIDEPTSGRKAPELGNGYDNYIDDEAEDAPKQYPAGYEPADQSKRAEQLPQYKGKKTAADKFIDDCFVLVSALGFDQITEDDIKRVIKEECKIEKFSESKRDEIQSCVLSYYEDLLIKDAEQSELELQLDTVPESTPYE